MTLVSVFWTWSLIVAVCAAGCAVARLVGQRFDDAEAARSLLQWQLMCEAIEAEDLSGDAHEGSSTSTA